MAEDCGDEFQQVQKGNRYVAALSLIKQQPGEPEPEPDPKRADVAEGDHLPVALLANGCHATVMTAPRRS